MANTAVARSDLAEHLFRRRRMQEAHAPKGSWHATLLSDEVLVDVGPRRRPAPWQRQFTAAGLG